MACAGWRSCSTLAACIQQHHAHANVAEKVASCQTINWPCEPGRYEHMDPSNASFDGAVAKLLRHAIRQSSRWLTPHNYIMRRLDRIVTSLMAVTETLLDAAVTRYGRVYIAAAAVLISLVAAVYFAAVVPEVCFANGPTPTGYRSACISCRTTATTAVSECGTLPGDALAGVALCVVLSADICRACMQLAASQGWLHAGGHAALGLVLLGNVAFNYALCVRTPPGTPEDLPHEVHAPTNLLRMGHSSVHDPSVSLRCPDAPSYGPCKRRNTTVA
jgi:hypothetical protein